MTWFDFVYKQACLAAVRAGYSDWEASLVAEEAVHLYRRDNTARESIDKAISRAKKRFKKAS